jgi:prepilin-type N-terminal cleavage/methylation domain-containing protein
MVILKKTNRGFTLIELLMVVAIIIVLATIVIISVREATDRAKNTKIITGMVQVRKLAEDIYLQESDGYTKLCIAGTLNDGYSNQMQTLHADITNHSGADPTCFTSLSSYCASSVLFDGDWFCIDDTGVPEMVKTGNPCLDADSNCK